MKQGLSLTSHFPSSLKEDMRSHRAAYGQVSEDKKTECLAPLPLSHGFENRQDMLPMAGQFQFKSSLGAPQGESRFNANFETVFDDEDVSCRDRTTATRLAHDTANASGMHSDFSHDRELAELRARCTQLEKTVRWWSDCTTTWRDKWSCIRNERNLARDELKRTKAALAAAEREIGQLAGRCDELTRKISRLCSVGNLPLDNPCHQDADDTRKKSSNGHCQSEGLQVNLSEYNRVVEQNILLKSQLEALADHAPVSLLDRLGLADFRKRLSGGSFVSSNASSDSNPNSGSQSASEEDNDRRAADAVASRCGSDNYDPAFAFVDTGCSKSSGLHQHRCTMTSSGREDLRSDNTM
uniref:Coiled-coil domain-containing protein 102A n=1 Tax=Schistocephalus solidus TaxID=70667 RepID=A0A0X3PGU5_SCHSO